MGSSAQRIRGGWRRVSDTCSLALPRCRWQWGPSMTPCATGALALLLSLFTRRTLSGRVRGLGSVSRQNHFGNADRQLMLETLAPRGGFHALVRVVAWAFELIMRLAALQANAELVGTRRLLRRVL